MYVPDRPLNPPKWYDPPVCRDCACLESECECDARDLRLHGVKGQCPYGCGETKTCACEVPYETQADEEFQDDDDVFRADCVSGRPEEGLPGADRPESDPARPD